AEPFHRLGPLDGAGDRCDAHMYQPVRSPGVKSLFRGRALAARRSGCLLLSARYGSTSLLPIPPSPSVLGGRGPHAEARSIGGGPMWSGVSSLVSDCSGCSRPRFSSPAWWGRRG